MKLHETIIVTVARDGRITLDAGGWRTPTTKGRMNDALSELGHRDIGISQQDGIWSIYSGSYNDPMQKKGTFADGMWVLPDGTFAGVGPDPAVLKQGVKLIRAYMKPVPQMIANGKFPAPGAGDPFNFSMVSTDGELALAHSTAETRKYLVQYMRGKYYFGSLLLRAMEKKLGVKHGDTSALIGMINGTTPRSEWKGFISVSPACCQAFAHVMNSKPMDSWLAGVASKQLADILHDYLKFWFNLAA